MFGSPDVYRPIGQISDYSYCPVMKAKSINFYVQDVPLVLAEQVMRNKLLMGIPQGLPYGVRTRVWSTLFPDAPFTGEMVSYAVLDETGGSVETLIPYAEFDISTVVWEDIIA